MVRRASLSGRTVSSLYGGRKLKARQVHSIHEYSDRDALVSCRQASEEEVAWLACRLCGTSSASRRMLHESGVRRAEREYFVTWCKRYSCAAWDAAQRAAARKLLA